MSAPAAAPVGALTLKPLSTHGLWLAVITMPAAEPRWTTSYELIWVGTARDDEGDRDAVRQEDLGRSRGEMLRREPSVVGDDDALGRLATLRDVCATPSAQRRTFSNVYSSAMRARQPSVPKTMSVGGRAPLGRAHLGPSGPAQRSMSARTRLDVRRGAAQHGDGLGRGHATALGRDDDPEPSVQASDDEVAVLDRRRSRPPGRRRPRPARRSPRAATSTTRGRTSPHPSSP